MKTNTPCIVDLRLTCPKGYLYERSVWRSHLYRKDVFVHTCTWTLKLTSRDNLCTFIGIICSHFYFIYLLLSSSIIYLIKLSIAIVSILFSTIRAFNRIFLLISFNLVNNVLSKCLFYPRVNVNFNVNFLEKGAFSVKLH